MVAKALAVDLSTLYQPGAVLGPSVQISTILSPILSNIMIFSGLFALIVIIFAGFTFITSGGDKNKVAQAQNMLNYGIMGFVLVVLAYLLTRIIGALLGYQLIQ